MPARQLRRRALVQGCGHAGVIEIDRLGMPDELPFLHIPA